MYPLQCLQISLSCGAKARAVEGIIFQHFAKNAGAIQKSLGIGLLRRNKTVGLPRLTSQSDRKNKCKSSFLSGVLPFWRLSICTSAFPKSARRCSRHYYLVVGPCPRGRLYSSMMTNLLQASSTDGHAWRMRDVLRRPCGNLPFYFQHSRIHHFALYPLRVAAMTGAMF